MLTQLAALTGLNLLLVLFFVLRTHFNLSSLDIFGGDIFVPTTTSQNCFLLGELGGTIPICALFLSHSITFFASLPFSKRVLWLWFSLALIIIVSRVLVLISTGLGSSSIVVLISILRRLLPFYGEFLWLSLLVLILIALLLLVLILISNSQATVIILLHFTSIPKSSLLWSSLLWSFSSLLWSFSLFTTSHVILPLTIILPLATALTIILPLVTALTLSYSIAIGTRRTLI